VSHRVEISLTNLHVLRRAGPLEHQVEPKLRKLLKATAPKKQPFSRRGRTFLTTFGSCDQCLDESARRVRVRSTVPTFKHFDFCTNCLPYRSTYAKMVTTPIETARSKH
jgi:hypothetical protein